MKALVTGGGGFIGLAIVKQLRRQGKEVRVFGRNRYPAAEEAGAVCIQGDIRDAAVVSQAAAGCDTVFHVAAKAGIWGPLEEYHSVNVLGTRNVLAACKERNVPSLVYTSTPSVVFDGQDVDGADESIPYSSKPLCHYAATKIQAELEVLHANNKQLRTAAIRPHLVWGPGDSNLIPRLLARGRARSRRIVGDSTNRVDISYSDNGVSAHLLAAENLANSGTVAGHAFFIGQQKPVQLWPWINDLFARMEIPQVTAQISLSQAKAAGWLLEKIYSSLKIKQEPKMTCFLAEQLAMSHWFSKNKAANLLDYREKVSSEQGMEQLVLWLRQKNL